MKPQNSKAGPGDEFIELETSLWDNDSKYHITALIPEVSEEKIRIDLEYNHLIISATNSLRNYKSEILLPDAATFADKRFENGTLLITLNKVKHTG
ncbi:MAG: Hsp20/alpha crystallin family protein [Methanospirillaceae archaeon]|nr:Hsp20/alpha crystallin family protein [Methanospirillaceae archaeon]